MFGNKKFHSQSQYKHVVFAAETSLNISNQSQLRMIYTLVNPNDILRKELQLWSQKIEVLELGGKELEAGKPGFTVS